MKIFSTKWLCVALFSISILTIPAYTQAGILSFLTGNQAQAATSPDQSSLSGLLQAAVNSDPTGSTGNNQVAIVDDSALLSSSGALGTAADVASDTPSSTISLYVVREGDSLSQIAKMFGVSVNTIIWANDITGPINPGDRLVILPMTGVEYTVKKGDTLESIAKNLGSNATDIASFNGVTDSTLAVGSTILIPDGELSSTQPIILRQGRLTDQNLPPEPAHNTNGPNFDSYYAMPLVSACVSQGLHGYNAVDLAAPTYTPIYAVAEGTVIVAKYNNGWNGGYGNYVVISHPNGTQTLYAHMKKVFAKSGQEVSQGDEIGEVGMTGEATGPHLHIEVRGAHNPFLSEYPSCY